MDFQTFIYTNYGNVTEREFDAMTTVKTKLLYSAEELEKLHELLVQLSEEISDTDNVPERFGSSALALLAEHDDRALVTASNVVHRLYMNAAFPSLRAFKEVDYRKENENAKAS